MNYFNFDDDLHFLFLQKGDRKAVYKLRRDYEWTTTLIDGESFYLGTLFSNMEIEEVVESLQKIFDEVELIEESEIDEYI